MKGEQLMKMDESYCLAGPAYVAKIKKEQKKRLKPCPFCGHELTEEPFFLVFCRVPIGHRAMRAEGYAAFCPKCGAVGKGAAYVDEAVNLWNRRPSDRTD